MNNSFWIILLAVGIYGLVHSVLASLPAKELARRWFGPGADRVYRLAYNIFAIASLLPVFALIPILPDRTLYTIPLPWNILTLLGQALAAVLLVVGLLHTGVWSFIGVRQLSGAADPEEDQLVVKGLYRWVRHPLYTAGLLFIWLAPLMSVNLLAMNLGLSLYLVIGAYFEERRLVRIFGPAYAVYQRETPMLIPGMRFSRRS